MPNITQAPARSTAALLGSSSTIISGCSAITLRPDFAAQKCLPYGFKPRLFGTILMGRSLLAALYSVIADMNGDWAGTVKTNATGSMRSL